MYPDSEDPTLGVLLTSQPLRNSTRTQHKWVMSHQSKKNFLVPKPRKQKEKESQSNRTVVTTNTEPPMVAKSPTQITNNFMGITPIYYMKEEIQKNLPLYTSGSQVLHRSKGSKTSCQGIYGYTSLMANMKFTYFLIKGVMFC